MTIEKGELVDELEQSQRFKLASAFIQGYLSAREGLKELNILRSDRMLEGDYAEWIVAELMDLQLAESSIQKGYDAVDKQGYRYQIKARKIKHSRQSTSFDIKRLEDGFDFLIGVLFSPKFELLLMIKVAYNDVVTLSNQNETNFRFRMHKKTLDYPEVEVLYQKLAPETLD